MKKLFAVLTLAGIFAFAACNPSTEDAEKAKQDSIRKADSIAAEMKKAEEVRIADSIAAAAADTLTKVVEKKVK